GRTLLEWLQLDPSTPGDPLRLFHALGRQSEAIAALGPGSVHEPKAFAWMVERIGDHAECLGAFGERALPVLLEHRAKVRDPAVFARAVVATGAAGARHALQAMQGLPPWERKR